jgi:predicted TIM-barrel fold metal-dependent hydrolase
MPLIKRVIDTHVHVGAEKDVIDKYPGIKDGYWWTHNDSMFRKYFNVPYPQYPPISLETLIQSMDESNISHTVIIGMDQETRAPVKKIWRIPPEYIKECVDRYPDRFIGIVGIDPLKGKEHAVKEVVRGVKELGLSGIKLWPLSGFRVDDKELCYPIYEKCVELGVPVQMHTGGSDWPGARIKYVHPFYVHEVAMDFPELKIQMLHCGVWLDVQAAFSVAAHAPNIYTDPSPAIPDFPMSFGTNPDFYRLAEQTLSDKFMFASDYPMCIPHRTAIEHIENLGLSKNFLQKFFCDNARRFYNIK